PYQACSHSTNGLYYLAAGDGASLPSLQSVPQTSVPSRSTSTESSAPTVSPPTQLLTVQRKMQQNEENHIPDSQRPLTEARVRSFEGTLLDAERRWEVFS